MPSSRGDTTISSQTLVRARVGDDQAWARILDVYRERVFRQILRSGVREPDASELVAIVFSTAFEKLQTFSRERPGQRMGKWLGKLAFHAVVNRWRQIQRNPALIGSSIANVLADASGPSGHQSIQRAVERAALAAAIAELSEDYEARGKSLHWNCFWQHCVECRTSGEVAHDLDVTVTYVTSNASRVRQKIAGLARTKFHEIIDK